MVWHCTITMPNAIPFWPDASNLVIKLCHCLLLMRWEIYQVYLVFLCRAFSQQVCQLYRLQWIHWPPSHSKITSRYILFVLRSVSNFTIVADRWIISAAVFAYQEETVAWNEFNNTVQDHRLCLWIDLHWHRIPRWITLDEWTQRKEWTHFTFFFLFLCSPILGWIVAGIVYDFRCYWWTIVRIVHTGNVCTTS